MTEKASQQKKNRSMEEMVGALSAQLDSIGRQLSLNNDQLAAANRRLDEQAVRFEKLESILAATQCENADLKNKLLNKDSEIVELKSRIKAVEQHSRASCLRIFKLELDGDENDPIQVAEQVYNKVLVPILQGAVDNMRLRYLPTVEQCITTAHILPNKDNKIKPILVRLVNPHMRTLVMQLKKEFAPKATPSTDPNSPSNSKPPPQKYSIFEDMTRDAFQLMRSLSSDARIHSCWCSGGQLRFRLLGSEIIQRVKSIYGPVEKIILM